MTLKRLKEGETYLYVSYVHPDKDADNYVTHDVYDIIVCNDGDRYYIKTVTHVE